MVGVIAWLSIDAYDRDQVKSTLNPRSTRTFMHSCCYKVSFSCVASCDQRVRVHRNVVVVDDSTTVRRVNPSFGRSNDGWGGRGGAAVGVDVVYSSGFGGGSTAEGGGGGAGFHVATPLSSNNGSFSGGSTVGGGGGGGTGTTAAAVADLTKRSKFAGGSSVGGGGNGGSW